MACTRSGKLKRMKEQLPFLLGSRFFFKYSGNYALDIIFIKYKYLPKISMPDRRRTLLISELFLDGVLSSSLRTVLYYIVCVYMKLRRNETIK